MAQQQLKFLNRTTELDLLRALLLDPDEPPSVVLLRAPSGFGKTTLTEYLVNTRGGAAPLVLRVDPGRFSARHVAKVYDGYFIQRCAAALDAFAHRADTRIPTFKQFVESRRRQVLQGTDLAAHIRGARGLASTAYGLVIELVDRGFGIGKYSATRMLQSDDKLSVQVCRRYLSECLAGQHGLLLIREAQDMDGASLDAMLELASTAQARVLLEYTTDPDDPAALRPEHVRLLDEQTIPRGIVFRTLDLIKLEPRHVEHLLSQCTTGRPPTTTFYTTWDGNIRRITELRWSALAAGGSALPLDDAILRRFHALPRDSQLLCLLVGAHAEPPSIDDVQAIMLTLAEQQRLVLSGHDIARRLRSLAEADGFLAETVDQRLTIANEDIARALAGSPRARGLALLATKAIRDHYLARATRAAADTNHDAAATRLGLRAAIELGDADGVEKFKAALNERIGMVTDKRLYAAMVLRVVCDKGIAKSERLDGLIDWATRLAFDDGDYNLAEDLLAFRSTQTPHTRLLMALIGCETNRHAETASITAELAVHPSQALRLAARLIQMVMLRLQGRIDEARILWTASMNDFDDANASYGHLLRFRELAWDFDACTDQLEQSVQWFQQRGHRQCAAYSQAALAFHLARQGHLDASRQAIDSALASLESTLHDRHTVLNNRAAVELFSERPDLPLCERLFAKALQLSSDGYADLVIAVNYAMTMQSLGNLDRARAALERGMALLDQPTFMDREVYWSALFNLGRVAGALGDAQLEHALRARTTRLRPHALQADLWSYRFGATPSAPAKYEAVLRLPHYPLFLSHWLIEPEVLFAL